MDFSKSMENLKAFSKSYDDILFEVNKYKTNEAIRNERRLKNRLKTYVHRLKKEGFAKVFENKFESKFANNKHTLVVDKGEKKAKVISPNYFSNDRIAVYSVLFGDYDFLREPVFIPDNCDFYIITDQEVPDKSTWKKVDISEYDSLISDLTNKEKNLYFRSHPHLLFKNYEYSVYMDTNVMPITDLTELVNEIGNCGMGFFRHPERDCIYDECSACIFYGIISRESGDKHIEYLESNKMPRHYGLLETGIIARKHHLDSCKKVMEEWWNEFMHSPRRDQLSLTFVLFNNIISVDEVAFPYNAMKCFYGVKLFRHKN